MKNAIRTAMALGLLAFVGWSGTSLAEDLFTTHRVGLNSPFVNGFTITTHDTNPLTNVARAIYVGGAGHVKMTLLSGDVVTLSNVQAGTVLNVRPTHIHTTTTTATDMVGLY